MISINLQPYYINTNVTIRCEFTFIHTKADTFTSLDFWWSVNSIMSFKWSNIKKTLMVLPIFVYVIKNTKIMCEIRKTQNINTRTNRCFKVRIKNLKWVKLPICNAPLFLLATSLNMTRSLQKRMIIYLLSTHLDQLCLQI